MLYGGVIEEVMLRLFVMSLLSFILWKIFYRAVPKEKIPVRIFAVANVIAALLFAAGHLPDTSVEEAIAEWLIRYFMVHGIACRIVNQKVDYSDEHFFCGGI